MVIDRYSQCSSNARMTSRIVENPQKMRHAHFRVYDVKLDDALCYFSELEAHQFHALKGEQDIISI